MFKPTFTDMQDKYCGDSYGIYLILSHYTKVVRPLAATTKEVARPSAAPPLLWFFFVLALNRVNIVAVTTIPVLRVGVIGHHVPRH